MNFQPKLIKILIRKRIINNKEVRNEYNINKNKLIIII